MILLDVSRLVWRSWAGLLPTGIDRTCLAYVAHYRDRAQAVVQRGGFTRILSPALSRALFDTLLDQGKPGIKAFAWRNCGRLFWDGGKAGQLAGRTYLNVGHTGLDKPGHGQWLQRTGVRPIYFLHDLIPLTHPEYCRPGEPEKHLRRMTALLDHAAGIIGNSKDTLNAFADFAVGKGNSRTPPTLVAPLGAELAGTSEVNAAQQASGERPYFLMLGTIEGRKNHLLMLNVWAEMARRLGPACPKLVVIGKRGWECEQAVDLLERCDAIRGHVVELPRCDDAELAAYMSDARALVFPSFVEGYGLPLVEALFCGTPVIASDLAVFRELAGQIPDYLSPVDGLGWMRVIEAYSQPESPLRDAQLARMKGWTAPTWNAHFAKVDAWLEQFGR
jgi:glycosyltransferase involved in cell wall biosynthesis